MGTITTDYNPVHQQLPTGVKHSVISSMTHWLKTVSLGQGLVVPVLGMAGYILLLGSIAVVYLSNQFPWFMAAPMTIIVAIVLLHHIDAKRAQQESKHH
ncbi:MAG: hypothetical protein QNJ78_03325 [Gammaproteobacteria bacterium]|nr:hypothetical protein [Gammaproteobacteria bacterium]